MARPPCPAGEPVLQCEMLSRSPARRSTSQWRQRKIRFFDWSSRVALPAKCSTASSRCPTDGRRIPMGCDMVLARDSATAARHTLLGVNFLDAGRQRLHLHSISAANHPLDAALPLSQLIIPQARQTAAVLGVQMEGAWGFVFGCNDQRVAVGVARWRSRLPQSGSGLSGAELTRLALERGRSARHAIEVLTDLIARFGQRDGDDPAAHAVFLVADPHEACVLETAGTHWAQLECSETRAVADVGLIRQDWKRLSHGLAEQVIKNGWWNDDGTKLDFAGSMGINDAAHAWGLKRWSKATLALAQRQGSLDAYGV